MPGLDLLSHCAGIFATMSRVELFLDGSDRVAGRRCRRGLDRLHCAGTVTVTVTVTSRVERVITVMSKSLVTVTTPLPLSRCAVTVTGRIDLSVTAWHGQAESRGPLGPQPEAPTGPTGGHEGHL